MVYGDVVCCVVMMVVVAVAVVCVSAMCVCVCVCVCMGVSADLDSQPGRRSLRSARDRDPYPVHPTY